MLKKPLKILSLLPAATEIVYLLGLEKYLVGVSDDCDYPLRARKLPKVTECLTQDLSSREIDEKVRELGHMGMSISHLDQSVLKQLKPNLILTQDLCKVCAVSYCEAREAAGLESAEAHSQVKNAARVLKGKVKIVSLEPESIGDILDNIKLVGNLCEKQLKAENLIKSLQKKLNTLDSKFLIHNSSKPKVLIIEWLDPIMIAGHWVPEMIDKAGGKGVITKSGQKSIPITIDQVAKADPDIIIFAPCGFNISRTFKERNLIYNYLYKIHDRIKNTSFKIYLMDGNAYLTRPGPRIIDGVEILAEILHPEIFPKKHKNSDWIALR